MSGEPETKRDAAKRLLIIADCLAQRFTEDSDEPLGVAGMRCDIAAIRLILDRLDRAAPTGSASAEKP